VKKVCSNPKAARSTAVLSAEKVSDSISTRQTLARPRLIGLGIALLTLLVFLPVWQHRFIYFDDPLYITENKAVQAGLTWKGIQWAFTDVHASMWHPVTWVSHMLDWQLFGPDPSADHLLNAVWHAACAALVFRLFYILTSGLWPSALAAALFAIHPLRVESVAWAAERKDELSAFFFLLMLLSYVRYVGFTKPNQPKTAPGFYGLSLLCFALGLMSKAIVVTAPFVLLLLDVWPLHRINWGARKRMPAGLSDALLEKLPFFALSAAVSIVTMQAQRSDTMLSGSEYPQRLRLFYSVLAYGAYLLKTIWPVHLTIVYPLPRQLPWTVFLFSAVALIGISYACCRVRRSRPHLLIGWLWFVGTLIPVIGLIQVGSQWMADRYTYLPHVGLFFALACEARLWSGRWQLATLETASAQGREHDPAAVAERRTRRRSAIIVAGLAVLACLLVTEHQLKFWSDGQTLFTHAIAVTHDNAFAHLNLAVSLEHDGQPAAARREYEESLRLDPTSPDAHANLADLLNEAGETELALTHYRESLRWQDQPRVHENLGALLTKLGQFEPAMVHYKDAARLEPGNPRPYYLMGKALLRQGQSMEAVRQFRDFWLASKQRTRTAACATVLTLYRWPNMPRLFRAGGNPLCWTRWPWLMRKPDDFLTPSGRSGKQSNKQTKRAKQTRCRRWSNDCSCINASSLIARTSRQGGEIRSPKPEVQKKSEI
jgi:Tfp pilus assembly protein PilF